jgi:hypothetical protein
VISSDRPGPGLAQQYRHKVETLEQVLAFPATHPHAVAAIRSQIGKLTLTPRDDGTLEVLPHDDLARILQLCERPGPHFSQEVGASGL